MSRPGLEPTPGTKTDVPPINIFGTDGIRGKVAADTGEDPFTLFTRSQIITPTLAFVTAFSFAELLIDNGLVQKGSRVVLGSDGRDVAFDGALTSAVQKGFCEAGLEVLDLGVVPTAMVPCLMLRKGIRAGAMLTASHNPANQNGIKFFIDGKKLLPEGPTGDFVLSAAILANREKKPLPGRTAGVTMVSDAVTLGASLVIDVLPPETKELLRDTEVVIDTANGAGSALAREVFKRLGISWVSKNEDPDGGNINRHCGVAEIEGTERFDAGGYSAHALFVRELFDRGRRGQSRGGVFGIALDGDADRAFLLFYDGQSDAVQVVDGDKCGYILADYFTQKRPSKAAEQWFVSTIESDIMLSAAASRDLRLKTAVVSVGDKWIGHFNRGALVAGVEVSGHVIFPVMVAGPDGKPTVLLSGNGLLTGLLTLAAIKSLRLPPERIYRPFEPGFSRTRYIYFVDKTMFHAGSSVWNSSAEIVGTLVTAMKADGRLPQDTCLTLEPKEDPGVLYCTLSGGEGVLGCVFMRNSGTEDKTAIYVKGRPRLSKALDAIGAQLQKNTIALMKNRTRAEYAQETYIMAELEKSGEADFATLRSGIERALGAPVRENDLYSVVYGLKKEGRAFLREENGTTIICRS